MHGIEFEPRGRTTRRQALGLSLSWTIRALATIGLPGMANAAHTIRPWAPGKLTPPLSLTDLDGKVWTLAALQGHVVVLNFWASWCEPCRAEMPSLELLATRHERAGLMVLAVNFKEPVAAIKRFLEIAPFSLPILLDRDGDCAAAWTPRMFPSTVLIDRNGIARTTVVGELDWMGAVARDLVEPLLAKPKTV